MTTTAPQHESITRPMVSLGVVYAVFFAISFFTVPMGDDWGMLSIPLNWNTWDAACIRYTTFNPRLMEDLLVWASGLPDLHLTWRLLNPFVLLWVNCSLVGLAVDRETVGRRRYLWLLVASSLIFFTTGGNRGWNQFWMSGGVNWLWSHAFILCMFSLLVRACRRRAMGWWRYLLLFVCGVVTGWSTENASLTSAAIFGAMALVLCRKGCIRAFLSAGAGLAVGLAFLYGSLFFIIGLDTRTGYYSAESLAFRQLPIWKKLLQPPPPALLYLLGAGILLLCLFLIDRRKKKRGGTAPASLPLASLLWAAALFFAILPLPMIRKWCAHATMITPSLVLITGALYFAGRLGDKGLRTLCIVFSCIALPYVALDSLELYALNRQNTAIHEAVEHALATGQKEIVVPHVHCYVPDLLPFVFFMDAHISPYLWEMGDNPNAFVNDSIRLAFGLSQEYRVIFVDPQKTGGK